MLHRYTVTTNQVNMMPEKLWIFISSRNIATYKLKGFLIQFIKDVYRVYVLEFIKKYQSQYRYLGKYLLDIFFKTIFVFLIDITDPS